LAKNTCFVHALPDDTTVVLDGVPVNGNSLIRIGRLRLTLRQLGASFTRSENFLPLFSSPPSASGGRPRSPPDEVRERAERSAVATATAVLFVVFNGLPTPRQLRLIHQRITQHRIAANLPCDDDVLADDSSPVMRELNAGIVIGVLAEHGDDFVTQWCRRAERLVADNSVSITSYLHLLLLRWRDHVRHAAVLSPAAPLTPAHFGQDADESAWRFLRRWLLRLTTLNGGHSAASLATISRSARAAQFDATIVALAAGCAAIGGR
jgi:hypothetical protein